MKIAMIGTGYVGLVSGTCFSEFGHDVVCVDKDARKIEALEAGRIPIFEPGLENLVESNVRAGRLTFTTDLKAAMVGVEAVFIAVGTPSRRGDGAADLSYVYAAAKEIAEGLTAPAVVVTKSTVPVGTGREVMKILTETRPDLGFDVASNPEFLREGSAIEDFMRPDRVVCGVTSERAEQVMRELYRPLFIRETPIVFTGLETAELIKYAANAFLAVKITYINEIADLCEAVGADVQHVAKAIGLDGRIGGKFLHPGPGYGGSCFPKDTRAITTQAQAYASPLRIVEAVVELNERRKAQMADRIVKAAGGSVEGKTVAMLGLTFKPNTDDMRESPSLTVIPVLQAAGATVRAVDPEGVDEAAKVLSDVTYCPDAYVAAEDADVVVLMTEWNAFRALDLKRLRDTMRQPVFVDLRNVYTPSEMAAAGFVYTSIGRPGPAAAARPLAGAAQ